MAVQIGVAENQLRPLAPVAAPRQEEGELRRQVRVLPEEAGHEGLPPDPPVRGVVVRQAKDAVGLHVRVRFHGVHLDHELARHFQVPNLHSVVEGPTIRHGAVAVAKRDPVAHLLRTAGVLDVQPCRAILALRAVLRWHPKVRAARVRDNREPLPRLVLAVLAHLDVHVVLHVIIVAQKVGIGVRRLKPAPKQGSRGLDRP
mmetsp:Transcript_65164/g.153417  ORF Transcript_65164/g.153417 Transcript_65164/m.153417 type:complete len:201 (-) Transcript_65164:96-698(-)